VISLGGPPLFNVGALPIKPRFHAPRAHPFGYKFTCGTPPRRYFATCEKSYSAPLAFRKMFRPHALSIARIHHGLSLSFSLPSYRRASILGIERRVSITGGERRLMCTRALFFHFLLIRGFFDGLFSTEIPSDIFLAHIRVYPLWADWRTERYSLRLNEEKSRSYLMRGFLDPRACLSAGVWMLLLDP